MNGFLTCCAISLVNSGSQWPSALTAIPAVKSRYRPMSSGSVPHQRTAGGKNVMEAEWADKASVLNTKLKVLTIFDIPQVAAFTLHHHRRGSKICCNHIWFVLIDQRCCRRVWRRVGSRQGSFSLTIRFSSGSFSENAISMSPPTRISF